MDPNPSENEPRPTGPRLLLFPLRSGHATSLSPLIVGVVTALLVLDVTSFTNPQSVVQGNVLAVLAGVLSTALFTAIARRAIPDGLRLTDTALELMHGQRILRRVDLTRLQEVSEFEIESGPVLMVSDKRRHITLPSFALADARHYQDLTHHIVEALERIDPSGSVARGAVSTGRLRKEIAEQPVRGTYFLTAVLTLASILAMRNRESLAGELFPDEAVGALSGPLIMHGELFRLFSYAFHQPTFLHLAVCTSAVLFIGGYLEKLLGWERVVLGFVAGVLGGALAHLVLAPPVPALGAAGGVYGLFGLLGAVTALKRRRPPTLVPHSGFRVMTVLLVLLLLTTADVQIPGPRLAADSTGTLVFLALGRWFISVTAIYSGGFLLGFLVGGLMIIRVDIPASAHARIWMRPFAILGCVTLAIGLVGGLLLLKRDRQADEELLFRTLLRLPRTEESGGLQNQIAYPALIEPRAKPRTIELSARLAQVAAENTDRQDATILDTLAVARYRQKRVGEARSLVNEALRLVGDMRPKRPDLERAIRRHAEDIEKGKDLRPDAPFDR